MWTQHCGVYHCALLTVNGELSSHIPLLIVTITSIATTVVMPRKSLASSRQGKHSTMASLMMPLAEKRLLQCYVKFSTVHMSTYKLLQ